MRLARVPTWTECGSTAADVCSHTPAFVGAEVLPDEAGRYCGAEELRSDLGLRNVKPGRAFLGLSLFQLGTQMFERFLHFDCGRDIFLHGLID